MMHMSNYEVATEMAGYIRWHDKWSLMGIEHLEIQDRLSARGYGELSVTRGMIIVYQVGPKWLLDWTKADD